MPLSWNEIKTRATTFSKEWEHETSEDAEAKSFWDGFFNIFGISRRRVATFEQQVKKIDAKTGFIDLLWKGVILIEHKSRGKDLDRAYQQAKDYFPGLKEKELPRYILVSDFERFRLYDLDENTSHEFTITELINNVQLFGFIAGYQKRTYKEQDPVNIEAAELMGELHDKLKTIGYEGHQLEVYLVRLLFCLFADDTSIFERGIFYDYIDLKTSEDGSDLARAITELFQILNTPNEKRFKNIDESLAIFPYVNGKLFEEYLPLASFDSEMRKILLDCCLLDWGKISPAIFGSLFQSVMDEKARRNLGAHYTSEKNILKLIKPLFLDDLWKEFEKVKDSKANLQRFHDKISRLRFLDPACGCGNFLIIAYRQLRLLEIEIIKTLLFKHEKLRAEVVSDAKIKIETLVKCEVDRFYGIEFEEFPAQIAQVAMWLIDHQMNQLVTTTFGDYMVRIPLVKSATILCGNALRIDWQNLLKRENTKINSDQNIQDIKFDFIISNPPFVGKHYQTKSQKEEINSVFYDLKNASDLDYVCGWYKLACDYLLINKAAKVSFVSTNSITQGEQVPILWNYLFAKYKIKIHFAHRTFRWSNEAKGKAHVHVVIIGFAAFDTISKQLFEYEEFTSDPSVVFCKNISPYLTPASDIVISKRQKPIGAVPEMRCGNKPSDGGFLILDESEKNDLIKVQPFAKEFIKEFMGSEEFINKKVRYCLWLKDASPGDLKKMPEVIKRIEQVKEFRLKSTAEPTRRAAQIPSLFFFISQPQSDYIVIPEVSSERRNFIPIGFLKKDVISSNKIYLIESSNLYLFGILASTMHMSWMRLVGGRLESRYQYSGSMVYNNFPWPENSTDKQKGAVEKAAQSVLDARASFPNSSLADLYDPHTMPLVLVKAHRALDKTVDLCYRSQPFINETKRIEFLFELYDKYTAGLFVKEKKKKRNK